MRPARAALSSTVASRRITEMLMMSRFAGTVPVGPYG